MPCKTRKYLYRCQFCGGPKANKTGAGCQKCYNEERARPVIKCCDCGTVLSTWADKAGSKRCRKCAPKISEVRNKRSAAMKKTLAADPRHQERFKKNVVNMHTPEARAKRAKKLGIWRSKVRDARLGWCPDEYRKWYSCLRKEHVPVPGYNVPRPVINGKRVFKGRVRGSVEARAIVEKHFGGPLRPVSMTWPQFERNECTVGGKTIPLGPIGSRLIFGLLLRRPDSRVPLRELVGIVYDDPDLEPETSIEVIRTLVHNLRKKGVPIIGRQGGSTGYRIMSRSPAL